MPLQMKHKQNTSFVSFNYLQKSSQPINAFQERGRNSGLGNNL